MPIQVPEFKQFDYGRAVEQGNRNALMQMQMQDMAQDRPMKQEQGRNALAIQRQQMDEAIRKSNIEYMHSKLPLIRDQNTWSQARQDFISKQMFSDQDLPEQFDPGILQKMSMIGRNDKRPTNPASVQEYQYYMGLPEGQREEYLRVKRNPQTINLGDRVIQPGMNGGMKTYTKGVPQEKTPEYRAEIKRAEDSAKEDVKRQNGFKNVKQLYSETNRQWGIVEDAIDKAVSQVGVLTAGLGAKTAGIPGTPAKDLSETLNTIKANIGFDKLQRMREASPTGGALGQVSEMENKLLQSVQGSLAQDQSPEQLIENLSIIKQNLQAVREEKARAFINDYGDLLGVDPAGQQQVPLQPVPQQPTPPPLQQAPQQTGQYLEGQTATHPQTGQKIIFRGGTWQPMQ